jgi:hypothetical protein
MTWSFTRSCKICGLCFYWLAIFLLLSSRNPFWNLLTVFRDILVRIRIITSDWWVRILLRNPDPSPVSIVFKNAKKIFFSYFFLKTCPQAHHLQSKKFNFCQNYCIKMLFCRHYFSPLNTFMRKGKDPESDPYLWLINRIREAKNMWIMRIRIPNTAF